MRAHNIPEISGGRPTPVRPSGAGLFSRYNYTVLLLMVFGVELAVGMFVIRDLRTANVEAQSMYAESVLGLRRIGELQYDAQETRRSTLYALTTNDSNLQLVYVDQSRDADRRVSESIAAYLQQAQNSHESEVGKRLQDDWSSYLAIRDKVLASILEGSTKEAVDLDLSGGVPSFDHVRQDLEEIKRLYDEQASRRLANVAATSRRSVVRLIVVLFSTLLLGSLSLLAIQRSKVLGTLQLAKLQMDFVASISHELRTPLAVIGSAADNIVDGFVGGKDQLKSYGALIRKQSRQMTALVNQILLFVSTKDGRKHYEVRPLEVAKLVQSVIDSTAELIRGAGFVIEQHIAPELPACMGDFSALSQCLQNLIVNAVKYGGESRWIGIHALTEESAERHGREIRIIVQDRGIGIEPAELSHIFEPFYRSPRVSAAQIHGTGLGLPLAKNIAEAMGGRLSVVSKPGLGSAFTLHLPIAAKSNLEVGAVSSQARALNAK